MAEGLVHDFWRKGSHGHVEIKLFVRPLIGLTMKGEGQRVAEVLVQYLNQGTIGI